MSETLRTVLRSTWEREKNSQRLFWRNNWRQMGTFAVGYLAAQFMEYWWGILIAILGALPLLRYPKRDDL